MTAKECPTDEIPQGLTSEQAQEAVKRGEQNRMPRNTDGGVWMIVQRNIFTLFNLLNLVLAFFLIQVGSYRNLLFLGVVLSNAVIGLTQELRAKRTHDRLLLLSEGKIKTLRDGKEVELAPDALVAGDVVVLQRGDQIPADAVVLCGACEVNESLLTGESDPVPKAAADELRSGSFLNEGTVTARLTHVGASSYAGQLQMSARKLKRPKSELMDSMQILIRRVSMLIIPVGLLLYWKQTAVAGLEVSEAVTKTVGAVLGMIPEGLILLTSVALAVGVIRLGRRNALVNELYGIESLARTDVVCLDKTGTLTCGEMTLESVLPLGSETQEEIAERMAVFVAAFEDSSPTNTALRTAFGSGNGEPATQTVPFGSDRKWSAAAFEGRGSMVLGAPERILLNAPDALAQAQALAAQGLRVLALLHTDAPLEGKQLPVNVRPIALLCLKDMLRDEVRETVRYFEEQGVTLKVISGDSPLTVASVAADAGLRGAERAIDLSACKAPVNYDAICEEYAVFGRVSPEDKRELVHALKRAGHGVAMIGDGVNDIPALKAADCSIAMAGGSDAACRVAQMTLLDADFSVVPQIVLEGRRVINNITRASSLFLVKNIFSLVLAVALLALPFVYPFAPIQLTLVSTLTIGIPSFFLALQPSKDRVRGSFLRNVFSRALPGGLCVGLLSIVLLAVAEPLRISEDAVCTLCTMLAGYSGICVMLMACRPLDWMRAALVILMTVLMVAAILLIPQVFYLVPLTGAAIWVLAAIVVCTPPALWGMGLLLKRIWKEPDSGKKKVDTAV